MKSIVLIVFFSLSSIFAFGQLETYDNYTGPFSNNSSWSTSRPSEPITQSIDIEIYGYITKTGNLTLNQSKSGSTLYDLIVIDTLVVEGNFEAANNAHSLVIPAGGVVVIFGDFIANNKVDLSVGGTLVVTGDMTLNGGNQDYNDNGGSLYVDGTISGNGDTAEAQAEQEPSSNLDGGDSGEQSLYNFIQGGGSTPLPITLAEFKAETANTAVNLSWSTLSEENFSYFEIQRAAADGEFDVIATIDGNGWSADERNYTWSDENPRLGINYYRLESVDYDGYRETFKSVAVIFEPTNSEISINPNPAPLNSPIKLQNTFGEEFTFKLISLSGKTVLETSGSDNEIIMPSNMESGVYIVRFEINGLKKTQKLIIK
ncbi:MAG: T9SS type A sorting domain-containing protein [Cyclobacteriaceae bacterium]